MTDPLRCAYETALGLAQRVSTLAFVATSRHVEAVLVKDIEYVLAGGDDE